MSESSLTMTEREFLLRERDEWAIVNRKGGFYEIQRTLPCGRDSL